jgi:hypothetical protein
MNPDKRAHVHRLIDHLPPGQLAAIVTLLESMIDDEELTEEDRRALRASDEYVRNGGEGIPFEQVVAELASPWNRFAAAATSNAGCEEGHSSLRRHRSGSRQSAVKRVRLRAGNHRVFFKETDETGDIHRVADRREAYR